MKLEYLPQDAMFPLKGLDTYGPSTFINPALSPNLSNMDIDLGIPSVRSPLVKLGDTLGNWAEQVDDWDSGTSYDIDVFVKHSSKIWKSLQGSNQNHTPIHADDWLSPTTYAENDLVRHDSKTWKSLQNGNQGNTPVEGAWWTLDWWAEICDVLTGLVAIGIVEFDGETLCVCNKGVFVYNTTTEDWDGVYMRGITWTGGNFFDYTVVEDTIYFTNGVDSPLKGTFVGGELILSAYSLPGGLSTFSTIETFMGRVFIGGLGEAYRDYIYWSVPGDPEDWSSFGSGFYSFSEMQRNVRKLIVLGARLLIFSDDSIGVISYVGGDVLFSFEILNHGIRLLSGRSVVSVGPYILFASAENIYLYDGTRMLRPVGNAIKRDYRDLVGRDDVEEAFAVHDPVKHRVYWYTPTQQSKAVVFVFEYDVYDPNNSIWFIYHFDNVPTTAGFYTRETALQFDSFENDETFLDIDPMMRAFDVRSEIDFPFLCFGFDDEVFLIDRILKTSANESVKGFFETKDFVAPDVYKTMRVRWVECEIEYAGFPVDVYTSTDEGKTWSFLVQVGTGRVSDWTKAVFYLSHSSQSIRFKFEGESFYFRWFRVWYVSGGFR